MNKRLTLFAFTCLPFFTMAQNDARLARGLSPVATIHKIMMPQLDNEALLAKEMERRNTGVAPRFAESFVVNYTPDTHGQWENSINGNMVWRLVVRSQGALSLNFGFTKYKMPPGGSLVLYSSDYEYILGPFTPADNEEHEQLWTPVIPGDEVVIEVQLPPDSKHKLELELSSINHDFLGFGAVASGSCNVDVICGAADGWAQIDDYRDIIRSVAVIGTNGNTYCSGFLVNNARNDCTPYFITARHCSIINANAATMVAYWNYENSYCREVGSQNNGSPGNGSLNLFNTGAYFRASSATSDFTLLELDDPVPDAANAFYAGWSNLPVAPGKAVGIHHPNAEEKRISFENQSLMLTNGLVPESSSNFTHVRVIDWDHGTTEQGSSGSPLFDQNKRVVGQLHGGAASCTNDKSDWYGSFAVSWNGNGSATNRLKDWLDPDNTGITTLDGREHSACNIFVESDPVSVEVCSPSNPEFQIFASETFSGPVTLSVSSDMPGSVDIIFGENPITPGTTTSLQLDIDQTVPTGNYTLNLTGSDGVSSATEFIAVTIFETVPIIPELASPEDGGITVSIIPQFTWFADQPETTYEIQIASDPDFLNLVASAQELVSNSFAQANLEKLTEYFWRVRAENSCGKGEWSDVFSFTTADIQCVPTTSADVPVMLEEENTPLSVSTIDILENGQVTDVNVTNLDISHTWVGDLVIELESPAGTIATLMHQPGVPPTSFGCPEDNLFLTFDDEATEPYETLETTCNSGSLAINGAFQPFESLKTFNGETAAGTWKLKIMDMADGDGGTLNGWDLDICSTIIPDWSVSTIPTIPAFCTDETIEFQIMPGLDFDSTGIALSASGNPQGSSVMFGSNNVMPGELVDITVSGIMAIGNYPITFTATDGTNTTQAEIVIQIVGMPDVPQLHLPGNGQTGIPLNPILVWLETTYSIEYLVEIATDPAFLNIVSSNLQTTLEYPSPELIPNQPYYWRVTAKNPCGETLSQVFSFTTDLSNTTESLNNNGVEIFPNPSNGKLFIRFGKPPSDKLRIELFASNGQRVKLLDHNGFETQVEMDLQQFSSGVYWLRLVGDGAVISRRIVLRR